MINRYLFLGLILCSTVSFSQIIHRKTLKLMGSRFDITVEAKSSEEGEKYINLAVSEIERIEKIISSWDENSQTALINKNAGIQPVKVDLELINLINRSLAISKLTSGAFDISYASMDKIWKFDGSMKSMPSKEKIKTSVAKVGYQNIIINKAAQTVYLKLKGSKIGFGAIGKGYAADKAKELLISKGVKAGIINASGDMNTWGVQPNGSEWEVAITNPLNKNKSFGIFPISNKAVVTSGSYEKFVTFNNTRYSHIINPKTGYPSSGIISATIFAPKAELADALATSVFVMGESIGIDLINQLPNIECIIVKTNGEIATSKNIKLKKI